jgi:hypothetical protein
MSPTAGAVVIARGVVCGPDGVTDFEPLWAAVARKGARSYRAIRLTLLSLQFD